MLADIDAGALARAKADLAAAGAEVLAVKTEVTKLENIEALAEKIMAVFGGVAGLSKSLYHELAYKGARVLVSVLYPAFIKTDIMSSERNRPQDLRNRPEEEIRLPITR